jgi:HEAT repeat protein
MWRTGLGAWVLSLWACGGTPQALAPHPAGPPASAALAPAAPRGTTREPEVTKAEPDLFETYENLKGHKPWDYQRDESIARAMVARADPRWTAQLIKKLAEPMPQAQAPDFMQAWEDQLFWQATAARVLERIRSPDALEPLLNVMLDGRKSVLHTRALIALLPLEGTYARALQLLREPGHERTAASILGALGRSDAAPELVAATKRAHDSRARFALAVALVGLDAPAQTVEAFKAAFDSIPSSVIANGGSARMQLAQEAIGFRAPELVPWLLDRAARARDVSRGALLFTALNLARPSQLPNVERAMTQPGQRAAVATIRELMSRCQENFDCYLRTVADPTSRTGQSHAAIKAAHMLGVLGEENDASQVVTALASLRRQEDALVLRHVLARSISHLLPRGSPAIVRELERLAALADTPSAEAELFLRVAYRLRARESASASPP